MEPTEGPTSVSPRSAELKNWAARLLDIVYPPQCLRCRALVEEPGTLCAACWQNVLFIAPPQCAICGLPFAHDIGEGTICGECTRQPPRYDRARAVMVYNVGSRDLVLGFKYADSTHAAPAYGQWLKRAGRDLLGEADLLVPVPLHWMRLFRRRYNQAALLAHALGRETGMEVGADALVRTRRTPPLGRLNKAARHRHLAGAISLQTNWRERINGKRIILIDDVMTTGETADICTRHLRGAGAVTVDVLTLARVVRTEL